MPISSRKDLEALKEEELRREVVIPVLQNMGMKDVTDNHGVAELGKDIVGWHNDPTGAPINFVVVLKAGNLTGKKIGDAASQVIQAFNTPFTTGRDSTAKNADIVHVVTNGKIDDQSKKSLLSQLSNSHFARHVKFMNGDELWQKYSEFFPVTLTQLQDQMSQKMAELEDEAVYVEGWASEKGKGLSIKVKNVEKLTEKHTSGKIQFRFPDTPEGRQAKDKYLEHVRSGGPLELPAEFVSLELPEILQRASEQFGYGPIPLETVAITTHDPQVSMPVRIEIENEDGFSVTLDFIDWRMLQAGTEEVTFVNDKQQIPLRFQMTFNNLTNQANYGFSLAEEPLYAKWVVKTMDLERCLIKPTRMTITALNTGAVMESNGHGSSNLDGVSFDDDEYDFYKELEAIENVIQQPVLAPFETMSDQDHQWLALMRRLLREPRLVESWSGAELTYAPEGNGAEELTELIEGFGKPITYEGEFLVEYAGREMSLGRYKKKIDGAILEDPSSVREALECYSEETMQPINIRLLPGLSNTVETTFLDWVDAAAAQPYRSESSDPTT